MFQSKTKMCVLKIYVACTMIVAILVWLTSCVLVSVWVLYACKNDICGTDSKRHHLGSLNVHNSLENLSKIWYTSNNPFMEQLCYKMNVFENLLPAKRYIRRDSLRMTSWKKDLLWITKHRYEAYSLYNWIIKILYDAFIEDAYLFKIINTMDKM